MPVIWVDNSIGDNSFDGFTHENAVATINEAIAVFEASGGPGSTIRICNTGTDYTHGNFRNYLNNVNCAGYGWGEGEYCTIEGYDPSGGISYPTLLNRGLAYNDMCLKFGDAANYWFLHNFKILRTHAVTEYGNGMIYWSGTLYNQHTYFKIRNCIFEGQYYNESYDRCFYMNHSTLFHLDVQYCFLKNIKQQFFSATGVPYAVQFNISNNIFWNKFQQPVNTFRMNETQAIDFTFDHNTFINNNTSKYSGYVAYISKGVDFTHREDCFKVRNNFVYWINYGVFDANNLEFYADNTKYVGYNTYGDHNGSDYFYRNSLDVFEIFGNPIYGCHGDRNLTSGHSVDDQTTWFRAHNDHTYLWPETGWMLVPDVRPMTWEMTGTWEDPINGIRGAIQHSGIYKDDSAFDTSHSVFLRDRTGALETNHQVFIDRTEYFDGTGSLMFWDSSDVAEVSDTSDIEYSYDKEPTSTYGTYPKQASGNLHLLRTVDSGYTGVDGSIFFDFTALEGGVGDFTVYLDYTSGVAGPAILGVLNLGLGLTTIYQSAWKVPDDLMFELSDASFVGADLHIKNLIDFTATLGIADSYMTFKATTVGNLDSSHDATIADATTPIVWKSINTNHRARVSRGDVYVIDYYTPEDWWGFPSKNVYTYEDWNRYETILQYFGRFFHSPLYYNTQFPDYGTIRFVANSSGKVYVDEDYKGALKATGISAVDLTNTKGLAITPWIGSLLKLYSPKITPEIVIDDGTAYKLDAFISDNTVGIYFRYGNSGKYDFWSGTGTHPFTTDQTFYLSFYGIKE